MQYAKLKICNKCDIESYGVVKGLCQKCYRKKYREDNAEKHKQYLLDWKQNNPDRVRAHNRQTYLKHQDKKKALATLWYVENKDKARRTKGKWRAENKDRIRDKDKAYRESHREQRIATNNRRRARTKENGTYFRNHRDRLKQLERQRYECFYCGEPLVKIQEEHVVPISRGGRDSVGNIVYSCPRCNQSKKDLFIIEWKLRKMKNEEKTDV